MTTTRPRRRTRRALAGVISLLLMAAGIALALPSAYAASYTTITGDGSSWAGNAVQQWQSEVQQEGVTVNYTPDGSSTGRKNFAQGLADYTVSEIPYTGDTSDPQDTQTPNFAYSLLPVVAGGTAFMYNLPVNGSRFTGLNLTQAALAGIFSGQITMWNDPAIAATNPGVNLPAQQITVVVRSDGSGATAQFTLWMLRQFPQAYQALCKAAGCNASSATSYYPTSSSNLPNFTSQGGSNGVTDYTASTPYTISYDEYSYAEGVGFPVAGVQNQAGFFTTPTSTAVAVALTQAQINGDKSSTNYLSQDLSKVYAYGDPRTYPISAYSYLIVPAVTENGFDASHGATLGYFAAHDLCEGQKTMGSLGYSPLPMNLVLAAMAQVSKIPGVDSATQSLIASTEAVQKGSTTNPCANPTFKPGDDPAHNVLIDTAPFPAGCSAACQAPWVTAAAATNGGTAGKSGGVKGHNKKGATVLPAAGSQAASGTTDNSGTASTGGAAGGADGSGGTVADSGGVAGGASGAGGAVGGAVGGAGGVIGGSASGASATPSCDADTGVCTTPGATTGNTTTTEAAITPTSAVIPGERTWGGPQLAIAICIALALLLVVGPAVVSNAMGRRRPGRPR